MLVRIVEESSVVADPTRSKVELDPGIDPYRDAEPNGGQTLTVWLLLSMMAVLLTQISFGTVPGKYEAVGLGAVPVAFQPAPGVAVTLPAPPVPVAVMLPPSVEDSPGNLKSVEPCLLPSTVRHTSAGSA